MKTKLLKIFLLLLVSSASFANPFTSDEAFHSDEFQSDWHLSIEPVFSLSSGKLDEYVYYTESQYDSDMLSYLEWDIKNLKNFGFNADAGFKNVKLCAGFLFASKQSSGIVKDSDWQNIQYANCQDLLYKTNYSESSNQLQYAFKLDAHLGYNLKLLNFIEIFPYIGTGYSKISFNGNGGTLWYGNTIGTSSYGKTGPYYEYSDKNNQWNSTMTGTVLRYTREVTHFYLGSDVTFRLPFGFALTGSAKVSPYVYTFNLDDHPERSMTFVDICDGSFCLFDFSAGIRKYLTKKIAFTFNCNYSLLKSIRGATYFSEDSQKTWTSVSNSKGGAGYNELSFIFGVKFTNF